VRAVGDLLYTFALLRSAKWGLLALLGVALLVVLRVPRSLCYTRGRPAPPGPARAD